MNKIVKIILYIFLFAVVLSLLIIMLTNVNKKQLNKQLSIQNTRSTVQNGGGFIIDKFLPFYNVDYDFVTNWTWSSEEICRYFGVLCITVMDTLNFLRINYGEYTAQMLYNTLENMDIRCARDQYLFSVESFTQAENKRINTILSQTNRYINQNQFDFMFQFMFPVENNEINIYLWEFEMYVYLEMLDFLNMISQSGGQFMVNSLLASGYINWQNIPNFFAENEFYFLAPYTFSIDNFTLSRLIWYVPTGTWSYEFMLLLSLYNMVTTEPWLEPNSNIVHPESINPNFLTYDLQRNMSKGIFIPIVSPGSWVDFIFGSVRGGNTESKFKLEWNSSFSNTYPVNKKIINAYGQIVDSPDYSFNNNENPSTKNTYKDYLFNCLVYNILEYENPITLPYSNNNDMMANVFKFVDQNLALRKQDFNRRINISRRQFFSTNGCNNAIMTFNNINGNERGFTGYLAYMRENVLDTINDFPTFTLSGWFFGVVKPLIQRLLPVNTVRLVENNMISPERLIDIRALDGSVKPVQNPTSVPVFGACRSVTTCRNCRRVCNAACTGLRRHAANDYYGRSNDPVISPYYGIVISIESTFFPDQCNPGSARADDRCPPNYKCNGGYCKRCADPLCRTVSDSRYYLPAVIIKHIDGTIGRYGEFPLSVILGQEVRTGQQIGSIISYTLQCHFEFYAGTVNMIPWVEGGFGRNTQNALTIMNNWVTSLTIDISAPRSQFPTLFNYQYVPNDSPCIPNCNYPCKYKRRRDLVNTDRANLFWL